LIVFFAQARLVSRRPAASRPQRLGPEAARADFVPAALPMAENRLAFDRQESFQRKYRRLFN
jgi:hypothetical protein